MQKKNKSLFNILLVEDEFIIAADISSTIKKLGYNVIDICSTALEAIDKAIHLKPDLVILDIRLKGDLTGIDAALKIKEKIDLPIIYLTANSDNITYQKARLTNPEAYILKPIDVKEFSHAIENVFNKIENKRSLSSYKSFLEILESNINDSVLLTEPSGKIIDLNSAAANLLEVMRVNVIGKNINDVIHLLSVGGNEQINLDIKELQDNYFLQNSFGKRLVKIKILSIESLQIKEASYIIIVSEKFDEDSKDVYAKAKSDNLKNQFLAQMSHEVRTPLNNIVTFIGLLKDEFESKLPVGLEDSFDIINSSSKRLIRTIDLLINMSKLQTGNYDVEYEILSVHKDFIEDALFNFNSRAKDKNIEFIYENNSDNDQIIADRYSFEQIIFNLMDNAFKYTTNGRVILDLNNNDQNELIITIKDTGIGISEDYFPIMFTPFAQAQANYKTTLNGTGLGLALAKKYTDINNGLITVNSKVGEGTEIILIFKNMREKFLKS